MLALAVVSEAGVIHQHQANVGLNYHQFKRYPARPTFGRPYIVPPIGLQRAPLVPSFVFNSVPLNHAITPITVTRLASPLLHPPTSTITKLLPTFGTAPVATLLNHKPSVALNSLPINTEIQQGTFNIQLSPGPGFINQPATISSAPLGPPSLVSSAVPTITSSYETVNVIPEKEISYSISHQDYEYLKRHKVEGKDSPYNPIPGFNTSPGNEKHQNSHSHHEDDKGHVNKPDKTDSESALKRGTALNIGIKGNVETKFIQRNNAPRFIQGNSEIRLLQGKNELTLTQGNSESSFTHIHEEQTNIQDNSGPSLINVPDPVIHGSKTSILERGNNQLDLIQENCETNFIHGNSGSIYIEGNSGPSFTHIPEPLIQENIETSVIQQGNNELNLIQGESANSFIQGNSVPTYIQGNVDPSFINVAEPVVSKHIYFHVPPPDFKEPPRVPITNIPTPKKTYNILFIKAPSQNQQRNIYLQQLLQSRQNQIEDKTLIYVLSKKQDPVEVALPPQQTSKVSSPEVYFVKYRTKLGDITDDGNEHVKQSLLENISSSSSSH